jgi:LAGLIDADG endonuclease
LANASLDVALHDTYYIIINNNTNVPFPQTFNFEFEMEMLPFIKYYKNNFMKEDYNHISYYHPFFVGLLEGDGTITVDKISNKSLRLRIVISLLNKKENYNMLNIIKENIGGRLTIERNNRYATWIASSKTDLAKVFAILAEYPLLTTRKICQLNYAKECLLLKNDKDILNNWQQLKDNKYSLQSKLLDKFNTDFVLPHYFSAWLSGFIEAEGSFKLIKYSNNSIKFSQFVIGQNYEKHILNSILKYFNKENCKIAEIKTNLDMSIQPVIYYKIGLGGKEFRLSLKNHFYIYPLLGNKNLQYEEWINNH